LPETSPHSLEEALSSSGRIRILSLLSQVEQLHLTEISKRTDQSYAATDRHLRALRRADLVEEKDYGRVRIFRLRLENPRAKMLQDLILRWDKSQAIDGRAQA
jgi:DNA-binding transcriptional ArsR family regulator